MEDVVVVGLDRRLAGPLLEPGLRATLLHRAAAQHRRRDAVEHRRLMELDKGIRVLPMPAGCVATVNHRDVHIRMVDGGELQGRIKNFDRFALIVEHNGADHMIFKHAIASIKSPRTIGNYYTSHESS